MHAWIRTGSPFSLVPVFVTFVPTGNGATCRCGVVASRVKSMDAGACCDEFGLAVVHNLVVQTLNVICITTKSLDPNRSPSQLTATRASSGSRLAIRVKFNLD